MEVFRLVPTEFLHVLSLKHVVASAIRSLSSRRQPKEMVIVYAIVEVFWTLTLNNNLKESFPMPVTGVSHIHTYKQH